MYCRAQTCEASQVEFTETVIIQRHAAAVMCAMSAGPPAMLHLTTNCCCACLFWFAVNEATMMGANCIRGLPKLTVLQLEMKRVKLLQQAADLTKVRTLRQHAVVTLPMPCLCRRTHHSPCCPATCTACPPMLCRPRMRCVPGTRWWGTNWLARLLRHRAQGWSCSR